jgi:hypothetical protein
MSTPESHQICGTVPATLGHQIRARAAETQRTTSATVAELLALGMDALQRPEIQLVDEVRRLEQTAARIGQVTGFRSNATGCWFAPTPAAIPDPALLDASDLVALPAGLLLFGGPSSLCLDMDEQRISAFDLSAGEVHSSVDSAQLLNSAALALPALLQLAHLDGPGVRDLGNGLMLQRLPSLALRVSLNGIGPTVTPAIGWQWAAELAALSVRAMGKSVAQRIDLERALQGVSK